jgi:IS4 transposase
VLEKLTADTLVLFDLGFVNHAFYDQLVERGIHFVTRAKSNAAYQVEKGLTHTDRLRDQIVRLGSRQKRCRHLLRLVEVQVGGKWHRFVTSVTDEQVLSAVTVAGLYGHRWRIEEAFRTVKRLLGLAYFFGGSQNAVQVQVCGTWLLYAVLVDLTDAVAEEMRRPLSALSLEMVYRGLYHYSQARQRGETQSPVAYLAAEAPALAILKQRRTCARRAPPT